MINATYKTIVQSTNTALRHTDVQPRTMMLGNKGRYLS